MPQKREPVEIGERFGMLQIVSEAEDVKRGKQIVRRVVVVCDCGKFKTVNLVSLKARAVRSCGCSSIKFQHETKKLNEKLGIKGAYEKNYFYKHELTKEDLLALEKIQLQMSKEKQEKIDEVQEIEDLFFRDHTKISDANIENWIFRTREFLNIKPRTLHDILTRRLDQ